MGSQPERIRPDTVIARRATAQDGVVSHAQLRADGLSARVIDRRVESDTLRLVHRGVYAVGYQTLTRQALWRAALLAIGPDAALSHRDAGALWRVVRGAPDPVAITLPGANGRSKRRGIELHRAALPPGDVIVRDGLRVTSSARTLLDLAAILAPRALERALDEAHYLNRVSARMLTETLDRNRGRCGATALRRVLADHELGSTRTETALEERFLMLVRTAGLPEPRCQVWIGRHRVDFLWPALRLIVETDGEKAHRGKRRQARDADRDIALEAKGYATVHIDESEVDDQPGSAVSRVAEAIRGRAKP